ncbi:MAG: hypothetical protein IPH13_22210 [Planctomycetes bacterium]|nr:hypothetical protein [Planctomycetota bacterium]
MGSCGHEKCQGDCCGNEPLILEGGATGVYGEWQERRGDYVIATVDLVGEFDNGVLEVRAYTKAKSDTGNGTEVDSNTKITASQTGRRASVEWNPATGIGLSDLIRFSYKCRTAAGSWVTFRALPCVWFDAVKG